MSAAEIITKVLSLLEGEVKIVSYYIGKQSEGRIDVYVSIDEGEYLIRAQRMKIISAITNAIDSRLGIYTNIHILPNGRC